MRTRNHKADIPRQGHRTENNRLATRILFAGRLGKLALPYGSAPSANIGRRGFGGIDVVRHIDFRRLETASLLPDLIEIPDFDFAELVGRAQIDAIKLGLTLAEGNTCRHPHRF